ncbi:MAG: LysM peptidoglycan-binding domain-containing protein, partial [Pseudomonadota bacterium]
QQQQASGQPAVNLQRTQGYALRPSGRVVRPGRGDPRAAPSLGPHALQPMTDEERYNSVFGFDEAERAPHPGGMMPPAPRLTPSAPRSTPRGAYVPSPDRMQPPRPLRPRYAQPHTTQQTPQYARPPSGYGAPPQAYRAPRRPIQRAQPVPQPRSAPRSALRVANPTRAPRVRQIPFGYTGDQQRLRRPTRPPGPVPAARLRAPYHRVPTASLPPSGGAKRRPPQQARLARPIQPPRPHPESALPLAHRTVVVSGGDTLYGLARRYGSSVEAIMLENGLNTPRIAIGQHLSIPVTMRRSH